jgi:hypothetical protein
MNDDRLRSLLGQVDEPTTPDPVFADRLFEQLTRSAGRSGGAHAGLLLVAALVLVTTVGVGVALGSGLLKLPSVDDVTPVPTGSPVASATATLSATPAATPGQTPTVAPSASAASRLPVVTPPPGILPPGSTATVVVDGLNLREGPSTTATVVATLAKGDTVTVLHDIENPLPVIVSGVSWYWVWYEVPAGAAQRLGWVAAGEGGLAYLEPPTGETCDDLPGDGVTLAQLIEAGAWHRLACLGNAPLTLTGVIDFHCQGGLRHGTYEPAWMVDWCPFQTLTPEETVNTCDNYDCASSTKPGPTTLDQYTLDMVAAPGGPSVQPRGTIVRVTGHFDDPASATCRIEPGSDSSSDSSGAWSGASELLCREQFVVTQIEKLGFMALPPE